MPRGWDDIKQLPDRYRADAQAQLERTARIRARNLAPLTRDPTPPTRPPDRLLEPYATEQATIHAFTPGQLVFVIPGRVPLVNAINHAHWAGAAECRDAYVTATGDLCRFLHPKKLNADLEWDLVVHHLVGDRPGPLPDAGAVTVAVKGALDGMTRGDCRVLDHDRNVNEVYTTPRRGTIDVLYLTLRPSTGWPWPALLVPPS